MRQPYPKYYLDFPRGLRSVVFIWVLGCIVAGAWLGLLPIFIVCAACLRRTPEHYRIRR